MKHLFLVLTLISSFAFGGITSKQIEMYTNTNPKGAEYEADASDSATFDQDGIILIRQDSGTSCPGGKYWLVSVRKQAYTPVTFDTCNEDVKFKVRDYIFNNTTYTAVEGFLNKKSLGIVRVIKY